MKSGAYAIWPETLRRHAAQNVRRFVTERTGFPLRPLQNTYHVSWLRSSSFLGRDGRMSNFERQGANQSVAANDNSGALANTAVRTDNDSRVWQVCIFLEHNHGYFRNT